MTEPINPTVAKLIQQANEAAMYGKLLDAHQIAQKAVLRANDTLHKATQAAANYTYAALLWQDESTSANEALYHAKRAAELATTHTNEYYLSLTLRARIEAELGNFDIATQLLEELLTIYRRKKRQSGVADALRSLGDISLKKRDFPQAHQRFNESLEIYRTDIHDPLNLAGLLLSFGSLCFQMGQMEMAQQHWQEAHQIGLAESLPQIKQLASRSLRLLQQDKNADE